MWIGLKGLLIGVSDVLSFLLLFNLLHAKVNTSLTPINDPFKHIHTNKQSPKSEDFIVEQIRSSEYIRKKGLVHEINGLPYA